MSVIGGTGFPAPSIGRPAVIWQPDRAVQYGLGGEALPPGSIAFFHP
ncbi:hypothetical protein [uncultured Methylobacterium sp.]